MSEDNLVVWMGMFLLFGLALALFLSVPHVERLMRRKPSTAMETIKAQYRLAAGEHGLLELPVLEGAVDGKTILIAPEGGSAKAPKRYLVSTESVLPTGTHIHKARPKDAYGEPVPMALNRTGDPAFDRAVAVQGPVDRAIISYLSAAARSALTAAVAENVSITRDSIVGVTLSENPGAPEIETLLIQVVAVANAFSAQPLSQAERLAHNALSDPLGAVRNENARLLFNHHDLSRELLPVADAWATFDDPDIWVAAARVLDDVKRVPALLRVLEEVAPGQQLSLNHLIAARLLAETQPGATRLRMLTPSLLIPLTNSEPITHGTVAAVTLGLYADIDVVPALSAAVDRLGRTAREAIADIQSRHTGTPGQLSIVGEEAASGGLSEVERDESGAVSLAD